MCDLRSGQPDALAANYSKPDRIPNPNPNPNLNPNPNPNPTPKPESGAAQPGGDPG